MSSTAPPTRPSTATSANGTRNQVGSTVVSAPIGSAAMASLRSGEEPASSRPKISRITGASGRRRGWSSPPRAPLRADRGR